MNGTVILEVRHPALRPGVQRVDRHLAIDRAGDFGAAIQQIGGWRRNPPVAAANRRGFGQEIGHPAGIDFALAFDAAGKEFFAARAKFRAQLHEETARVGRQDFRIPRLQRADDLEASDNRMAHSCQSV